jgi:hypothetical protein
MIQKLMALGLLSLTLWSCAKKDENHPRRKTQ